MATVDPQQQRAFAVDVVRRLQEAGYEACFAGGCVRDQLLGRKPKDFDIATSARPDQIRELLGTRRTLAIGAAFGVITALGPRGAGQLDVATFRRDDVYSDGRHPDRVEFSTAQEDAQRRDFTINGMFFDPLAERVVDYVGGQEDLRRGIVRAIGTAAARISEDKLRMLRAVRFAATLAFELDPATEDAIRDMAEQLSVVSVERIAAEMQRMLVDAHRVRALTLLRGTRLLPVVFAGLAIPDGAAWDQALRVLDRLDQPTFPLALAALIGEFTDAEGAEYLARGWRLSNDIVGRTAWLVAHREALGEANRQPWPRLQRVLIQPGARELAALVEARAALGAADPADVAFCRERLGWPAEQLDPPPLITGDDLAAHGVPRGKIYRELLDAVRDAQLLGEVGTLREALALVDRIRQSGA
ncbi:MAG: CCA tRNA nucleotidyltransferase [Planctomycetia bacterium]|nr:CCA tRNA nucleotidyltransferase [Planctomycetia bacterium]